MPAYKDAKRNTWYAKFRYKDWLGETKACTKRGFTTKRDALQWEQDFKARAEGNIDMSFESFVKLYREDCQPRLKMSTILMKDNLIETKIMPYFGKRAMRDITTADVFKWQNEIMALQDKNGKPYSQSYLKAIHNQLSAIFNHAVRFYNLPGNPARIAGSMGAESGGEMKFWTKEQYVRFAEAIKDDRLAYCCFEMLYWCGVREGELLAINSEDLDFDKKEASITKTYHRVKGEDVITDPKTPDSKRKVLMPDYLCEEMKQYMEMQYDMEPEDRLFPVSKNYLYRVMIKGCELTGVPRIRIHDLRHSHVSLLIDMGFSAVSIAKRVGHKSIDITYRYAHMFPNVQNQMAEQLNQVWKENGNTFS